MEKTAEPLPTRGLGKLLQLFELVKFQHTLFALPFALVAMLLAAGGLPPAETFAWILMSMVAARSTAMGFNRFIDVDYDRNNPRTADRTLARGAMRPRTAVGFTGASAVVFVFAAYQLNLLCFYLSPVALGVILGYSYTKRFTTLCHLVLGLSLAIAPMGAWLGVTGSFRAPFWLSALLGFAVMLWTAGFDLIYACLDVDFDRRSGLYSIPARLGVQRALALSSIFHWVAIGSLAAFARFAGLGVTGHVGVGLVALLILYEHRLVKPDDLSRVNLAFFRINGVVGLLFLAAVALDVLVFRSPA